MTIEKYRSAQQKLPLGYTRDFFRLGRLEIISEHCTRPDVALAWGISSHPYPIPDEKNLFLLPYTSRQFSQQIWSLGGCINIFLFFFSSTRNFQPCVVECRYAVEFGINCDQEIRSSSIFRSVLIAVFCGRFQEWVTPPNVPGLASSGRSRQDAGCESISVVVLMKACHARMPDR